MKNLQLLQPELEFLESGLTDCEVQGGPEAEAAYLEKQGGPELGFAFSPPTKNPPKNDFDESGDVRILQASQFPIAATFSGFVGSVVISLGPSALAGHLHCR